MNLIIPLSMAVLSPVIWGLMNVLDKTIVTHKIKKPLTYASIAGLVNLVLGIILASFLDWSKVSASSLVYPIIAGILLGGQFYLYYLILAKEDVSHMVGILYIYPVIVAILSFFFLNETLSSFGYIGMFLILAGVLMISDRVRRLKLKASLWMIMTTILVVALDDIFIKVSTNHLPELNGIAISCIFIGLTILPVLFAKGVRKYFRGEFKNFKWAFLSESLTFLGIFTLYFAMSGLSATFVSSVAATQPLAVLFFEKIFHKSGARICRDVEFLPKLIPIILIVLGIILLYLHEILKFLR